MLCASLELIKSGWPEPASFLLTAFVLYLLLGTTVPVLYHKKGNRRKGSLLDGQVPTVHFTGKERVACIDDNMDALLWRARLIESAKHEILYSTFEFFDDTSGKEVLSLLYRAAERGVKVRIVIDAATALMQMPSSPYFKAFVSHPNIRIKLYNPINLLKPWRAQYHLHDKYVIADRHAYLLGGRNTYDRFLGYYIQNQNIDRELLIYEEAPQAETSLKLLAKYFEKIWSLPYSKEYTYRGNHKRVRNTVPKLAALYQEFQKRYPQAFENIDWVSGTYAASSVTLLSNPIAAVNKVPKLWDSLCDLMAGKNNVVIQTPYIICSKQMYKDLAALCSGTGSVSIVTNAIEAGDNPFGCSDYMNQKNNIRKTGAIVYESHGKRSNHTKTILIDDRLSIVGSYNLDMRSTYLDTELMLCVESRQLNERLRACAREAMAQSRYLQKDGSYAYGAAYQNVRLPLPRRILFTVLRVISIPIRHLL